MLPLVGAEFAALTVLAVHEEQQHHDDHKEQQGGNYRREGHVHLSKTDVTSQHFVAQEQL